MRLNRIERLKWGQEDADRERRGERGWQKEQGEEQTETRKRKDFHVSLWHTSTIHERGKLLIRKIFCSPCWLKYLQSPKIRETLWVSLHMQTAITLKAGISTAILLRYYFSHERIWMLQWGLESYRWDQEVAHKTILTLGVASHPERACVHLWESSPHRPCCYTSTRCEGPWAASGAAQLQNWVHQCFMKIHTTHCTQ